MKTTFLSLLLLSAPLQTTPPANPPQAPAPDAAAAKKRAEEARLHEAFKSLEQELLAALEVYQAELDEAKARGVPPEEEPKVPTVDYFARFEDLALQNQPDALRWCIGTVNMLQLTIEETNGKKFAYYERLVYNHPNSPFTSDIVRFLVEEGTPTGIGLERAIPLLDSVIERCTVKGVAQNALFTKSRLYGKSGIPEHKELRIKTLRELVTKFPDTPEGTRAKGYLFQEEQLAVGKPVPDFSTEDVDGVKFKLSDYRGKVIVVDFWGFHKEECRKLLALNKDLVARLANEPFVWIGVNTDGGTGDPEKDKAEFRRIAGQVGINWRNSWQGGRFGPLIVEWGIGAYPTTFVIDAKGIIRYRDVKEAALANAIDGLLAEIK